MGPADADPPKGPRVFTSNFEKLRECHSAFGFTMASSPWTDAVKDDPKLMKLWQTRLKEEAKECDKAIDGHNLPEAVDALADILYVAYGAGMSLGINLNAAFDIVHQSNMSKLCKTEEIAKQTVDHYKEKFAKGIDKRYD